MLQFMGLQRVGHNLATEQQQFPSLYKDIKVEFCHPAYLTYMHHTSSETPGWMKHRLESRLLGYISVTSDMQVKHPYGRK